MWKNNRFSEFKFSNLAKYLMNHRFLYNSQKVITACASNTENQLGFNKMATIAYTHKHRGKKKHREFFLLYFYFKFWLSVVF